MRENLLKVNFGKPKNLFIENFDAHLKKPLIVLYSICFTVHLPKIILRH